MKNKTRKIVRMNGYIGKPRKWVCYNHSAIDVYLEEIESMYFYSKEAHKKGMRSGWDACPLELLEKLMRSLATRFDSMDESFKRRTGAVLTESEARYCELEGILPEDFLARSKK